MALTPMFFRYCTWMGDELRRKHSDMSSSSPLIGESLGLSGTGCVFDIDQHPDAVTLIQSPSDLRDVGRGIAVAEIGFEVGSRSSENTSPWPSIVEAIDHHPVVAGQRLEDARGFIAQRSQRGGGDDGLQAPLQIAGQIDRRPGPLQFDDEATTVRAVDQAIKRVAGVVPHGTGCPRGTSCSESVRCGRSFLARSPSMASSRRPMMSLCRPRNEAAFSLAWTMM